MVAWYLPKALKIISVLIGNVLVEDYLAGHVALMDNACNSSPIAVLPPWGQVVLPYSRLSNDFETVFLPPFLTGGERGILHSAAGAANGGPHLHQGPSEDIGTLPLLWVSDVFII